MTRTRDSIALVLPAWVLLIASWIGHLLVREVFPHPPGDPIRLVATVGLSLAFAFFAFVQVRLARSIDEFQPQVHLTAPSFAYPAAVILVFAIGFLRGEGFLGGYVVAARRYR